jgi:hypothetical protein
LGALGKSYLYAKIWALDGCRLGDFLDLKIFGQLQDLSNNKNNTGDLMQTERRH